MNSPLTRRPFCFPSDFSEAVYEKLVDETLDALVDFFEDLTDETFTGTDYDVVFSVSLSAILRRLQHDGTQKSSD